MNRNQEIKESEKKTNIVADANIKYKKQKRCLRETDLQTVFLDTSKRNQVVFIFIRIILCLLHFLSVPVDEKSNWCKQLNHCLSNQAK